MVQTYDPSTEEAAGGGEFEISLAIQLKFCLTGDKNKTKTKKKVEINRRYLNTYISVLDRKPEGKEFAGSTIACVISAHLKMTTQISKEGVLTYGLIFQSPLPPVTSSMKANTKVIT